MSDDALFRQYIDQQDETCFDTLFESYSPRLKRFMRHRVPDEGDAIELVQQTFLVVHRSRADFRGESKFSTWIWAIAVNLRKDYLRKYLFRARFRKVDSEVEAYDEPEDFEQREKLRKLRSCVEKLPSKSREVVELHWYEELPFAEVAQVLGITESTAKTRASRSYEKLRKCLENA